MCVVQSRVLWYRNWSQNIPVTKRPSFSLLISLIVFPNYTVFLLCEHLHQSRFLFPFVLYPLLLFLFFNGQESLHVLGRAEWPSPAVWRVVCSLFDTRAAVPPFQLSVPFSFSHFLHRTFSGAFPLSSRKKFFITFELCYFVHLRSSSHV